jgi:hypothetical protein
VDAVQRVALLVGPHARHARRVFKEPVGQADFPNRAARGKIVTLQRHDLGRHLREARFGHHAKTAVQTEHVARLHQQRPQLIIAAHEKLDAVTEHFGFARRQARHRQPRAFGLM